MKKIFIFFISIILFTSCADYIEVGVQKPPLYAMRYYYPPTYPVIVHYPIRHYPHHYNHSRVYYKRNR